MTHLIFFEENRESFLPLVFTKPIAKLRLGILTIENKWKRSIHEEAQVSYLTEDYLSKKYPLLTGDENLFVNSRFLPEEHLVNYVKEELGDNEAVSINGSIVAFKGSLSDFQNSNYSVTNYPHAYSGIELKKASDLFSKNGASILADFKLITVGRSSSNWSKTNTVIGNQVFIEEGAQLEAVVLNASQGPIYIGKHAEIMEGSVIRGPFALCEGSTVKMGAKVYGPTTIGPFSKVGGELNNVVVQGYSNKGHDGFLGNSVIGEWCNLGADTNGSNLKNNYGAVKSWSYEHNDYVNTNMQFCGLIMGDHSKCGINTMFNTGTVVGVNANIYGGDFPPKFIPSFSWGGASGMVTYTLEKAFEVAKNVMSRRGVDLSEADKDILTAIFNMTSKYRG